MGWTTAEVCKYIKSRLGFPKRAVELDASNYEEALQRALRQLSSYKPALRYQSFNIIQGQQRYNLNPVSASDPDGLDLPFGKGIVRVYDQPIVSPQAVFNEFEYYRLRQPPYVDMGELLIDQMYYKEIGILTGTQFDWEWDQATGILLITPVPTRSRAASYQYNSELTKIEDANPADQGWIADYALAICKEMLGRVRGKFQGVPGTELPLEMDHADLLSEASAEQERLLESLQLKSKASWTPPIKG